MRSSWRLWALLVLMVLDCLQCICFKLSESEWVCILPHMTLTSDDGLKNSAGFYSVFIIQVITFRSFFIHVEFFYDTHMDTLFVEV